MAGFCSDIDRTTGLMVFRVVDPGLGPLGPLKGFIGRHKKSGQKKAGPAKPEPDQSTTSLNQDHEG
jgi:hypothetical protein